MMISIQLKSKEDLNQFKNQLRKVCEVRGIRLGKSEHKLNDIVCDLLGYKDYNVLVADVLKPEPTSNEIRTLDLFPERISVPSTTYGARDIILKAIRGATNVQHAIFAVRDGYTNDHALTFILIAETGIKVFDTTSITAERTPRELELLDILRALKDLGILSKARFIKQRIEATSELPSQQAFDQLMTNPLEDVFPEWKRFMSCFISSNDVPNGIFSDEDWEALIK